jgi:hypothetical protein
LRCRQPGAIDLAGITKGGTAHFAFCSDSRGLLPGLDIPFANLYRIPPTL